jgi:tetratricopeptide (TPR) repeat protein
LPLALRYSATFLGERRDTDIGEFIKSLKDTRKNLDVVSASLSLSYDKLSDDLKYFWRILSIFPSTFDSRAAQAVWEIETEQAKSILADLVLYSLLEWDHQIGRYHLHDLARKFAQSKLIWFESQQASLNYLIHYGKLLQTAEQLYMQGGESALEGLELLDLEFRNIESAQRWSAEYTRFNPGAAELCAGFPTLGAYILDLRLSPNGILQWRRDGLVAAQLIGKRDSEAANLDGIGCAYREMDRYQESIPYFRQALSIAREINNRQGEGDTLDNIGGVYLQLKKPYRASIFHKAGLEIAKELGNRYLEGRRLNNLALACLEMGNIRASIPLLEEALSIKVETGDLRGQANTHLVLYRAYLGAIKPARAILQLHHAIKLYEMLNDPIIGRLNMNILLRLILRVLRFMKV